MKMQLEITSKILVVIVAGILFLFFSARMLVDWVQTSEGRKAPTQIATSQRTGAMGSSAKIPAAKTQKIALSDALKMTQENPATMDFAKLQGGIAALEEALRGGNKDENILLSLGDLSFTSRDFSRSLLYLQQYSELHPDNVEILAKIGSCLTMLDRTSDAVAVLQKVVEIAPSDFKGHAYLAIALAKQGNNQEAGRYLERAIQLAPNQEAAERLKAFLATSIGQKGVPQQTAGNPHSETSLQPKKVGGSDLETWLANHPIVGGKLRSVNLADGKATVVVVQFPMDKMPETMKISFFAKLWTHVDPSVQSVDFVDSDSGKSMYVEKRSS